MITKSTHPVAVDEIIEGFDMRQALFCPRCNGTYLHHGEVEVFDRPEDGEEVDVVSVLDGRVSSHLHLNETSGNPSKRRTGVVLTFTCEDCNGGDSVPSRDIMELCIDQHKGQTFVRWRIRSFY